MPISYMGTKRHMATDVRRVLLDAAGEGPIVDLFSGMGSVAEAIAPAKPIIANDFLGFAAAMSRARFTTVAPRPSMQFVDLVRPKFEEHQERLEVKFARRIAMESNALNGSRADLERWLDEAPCVAQSAHYQRLARDAADATGADRFQLATLYFSAGYFSTRQAIDIDSLRYSIAQIDPLIQDQGIAALLFAAGRLVNAPGHTAQYLRPNSEPSGRRIRRVFARDVWATFEAALDATAPVSTPDWRSGNNVTNMSASALLESMSDGDAGAVYADPPYTRDQYARFYHVLETLFRYDFPSSTGRGRGPGSSYARSSFSSKRQVQHAFVELFQLAAPLACPLVISYPTNGLLSSTAHTLVDLAFDSFQLADQIEVEARHSTMGGSSGSARNDVSEMLYVFEPLQQRTTERMEQGIA